MVVSYGQDCQNVRLSQGKRSFTGIGTPPPDTWCCWVGHCGT